VHPDAPDFGLEITLVGMGIVFFALGLVVVAISLMRRLDERWQATERTADAAAFDRPPTIDTTTLVLLAAAAATLVVGRHRIRAVRRLGPGGAPAGAWSTTGRAVLQGSHVVVPHPVRR
jgi:Na+-transporting methylmalonyl-CoA/oxaloacetate decarboxylase gamma subunit